MRERMGRPNPESTNDMVLFWALDELRRESCDRLHNSVMP